MPESRPLLARTITVPDVQERSTVKRIHQLRSLTPACACREVMANSPTDESRGRTGKSQSRIRSQLSLGDPNWFLTIPRYTAATGKSTSESILPNQHDTWYSRMGWVVGWATTYKRRMTVQELTITPTANNHRTGSGRRTHLAAHLPVENRSWGLVDKHTLEEITSRVNKCTWRRVNSAPEDETTSELGKWQCGYPAKWQQANLEEQWTAYPEEKQRGQPAIEDKCTEHRADGKCTNKCTDLEDDQCHCKSTGVMMRWSSSLDLCRMSARMATEAVPTETENDLRTYQIVSQTASQETVETTFVRWWLNIPTNIMAACLNIGIE